MRGDSALCGVLTIGPAGAFGDPPATTGPTTAPAPTTSPAAPPTSRPATQAVVPTSPEIERQLGLFPATTAHSRAGPGRPGFDVAGGRAAPPQFMNATPNAEARARAQLVLNQIASNGKLGPTYVSLHLKDATPQKAFAELSRQCGIPITAQSWQRITQPTITLEVNNEPFWAAMRRVCMTFGLRSIFTGGDGEPSAIRLIRDTADEMSSPAAFNGSFMMLVTTLSRRSSFDPADNGDKKAAPGKPNGADRLYHVLCRPEMAHCRTPYGDGDRVGVG